MSLTRPIALITGASDGLGREFARLYAADGYDLILVARREGVLRELAIELEAFGARSTIVGADLASAAECERVLAVASDQRDRITALVNNAGLGTLGWFHEIPVDSQRNLIDVNISALTHLARGVLPWLRAKGRGHIMNLGSVASFQPGPLMAVYYASKAYVLSFSEALSNECHGTGVTVTAVCPGPTSTGFQRAAGISPRARSGGAPAMHAAEVAGMAYRATKRGKPVVLIGARNVLGAFLGRHLPRSWSAAAIRRIQEARLNAGRG
ncbi:MAG: SDR family NAD(P)-dependent oxidoreductase [Gemmatimonadota bacterium]